MKSRKIFVHWVSPILGAAVLIYALWSASDNAKVVGLVWLAIGCASPCTSRGRCGRSLAQSGPRRNTRLARFTSDDDR